MGETRRREDALERGEIKNTGYEIFIAALSILSIVNLVLLYVVRDSTLDAVLYIVNMLLTLIFMTDFLYRFFTVKSKSHYFFKNFGWADLLASMPFQQAKILRLFRLVKVGRLLEDQGAKGISRALLRDRAGSALLSLLLIAILMLEFGSLLMLRVESTAPGANITSASDAIWYIIVTMSTVGYGDQYPITNAGRILGTVIIIVGVGIFGTLTGYLANLFLAPRRAKQEDASAAAQPTVEARLAELKELIAQQQAAVAELEALITE